MRRERPGRHAGRTAVRQIGFVAIAGSLLLVAHFGVDALSRRDWRTPGVPLPPDANETTAGASTELPPAGNMPGFAPIGIAPTGVASPGIAGRTAARPDPATRQKAEQLYRRHSARISKMSSADMQKAIGKASQMLGRDVRGMTGR